MRLHGVPNLMAAATRSMASCCDMSSLYLVSSIDIAFREPEPIASNGRQSTDPCGCTCSGSTRHSQKACNLVMPCVPVLQHPDAYMYVHLLQAGICATCHFKYAAKPLAISLLMLQSRCMLAPTRTEPGAQSEAAAPWHLSWHAKRTEYKCGPFRSTPPRTSAAPT